ncbi:vWA domain-containing protein [Neorhizobium galegae]|uniref:vWA domain-containing protein n=1 Tax=Neorhizobium galegae TaxID=399 RepID=UPI002105BFBA|nr:VWA domain-containing protein [Neorhizobium galegae]MCQ1849810.1 VWA domain-containing protein [Neorhizobium galegae]
MRVLAVAMFAISCLFMAPAQAAEQSIIVLDASGSMWGQIGGKAKMEIARETLSAVLQSVPADSALGLMVYGHRDKGSCDDIELAIPPAVGTADKIRAFVKGINPKGKTPLSQAVREAAEALKYTEEKATVILVTDGLETCEADPCALANELEKNGVDFTAHVVGFGLTKEEGKQVACLAENTGGKYLQASDAKQLAEALKQTVVAAPKPVEKPAPAPAPAAVPQFNVIATSTLSEGGPPLGKDNNDVQWLFYKADASGQAEGDYLDNQYVGTYSTTLEPGSYVAQATLNNSIKKLAPFEVKPGAITKVAVNFDAAHLTVLPKRTPQDKKADDNARVDVAFGDYATTFYGTTKAYVAAGDVKLTGSLGAVTVEKTVAAKAGEKIETDLVIGAGMVVNRATYVAGGPPMESSEIFFEVVSPTMDINGARKSFNSTYGTGTTLEAPAGDLILTARLGSTRAEIPFSIKAGERKDVTINIQAGVLAVAAPDSDRIVVFDAKKDIQGNQKEISYGFGPEHKDTLPAGDYVVKLTFKGDKAPEDRPVTIKAGERSEMKVD